MTYDATILAPDTYKLTLKGGKDLRCVSNFYQGAKFPEHFFSPASRCRRSFSGTPSSSLRRLHRPAQSGRARTVPPLLPSLPVRFQEVSVKIIVPHSQSVVLST